MQEIDLVARFLLGALFLTSAITKFGSLSALEQAVRQQGLGIVDPKFARIVARLLSPLELLLALSLIVGIWLKIVAFATMGLLIVFTVPMAINVVKGNRFPCNCFGQTHAEIGIGTLSRNGVMIVVSLTLALTSTWTMPGSWSLSLALFSLSSTNTAALVILGVSLYLIILSMSYIDTIFHLLRQKKRSI